MGDSGRAETEQALLRLHEPRENERKQDWPSYYYPTTRTFGGRKRTKKCYRHHILSTTRETKQKTNRRCKRGKGKNERYLQIKSLNACKLRAEIKQGKGNAAPEGKIKDNSDE